MSSTLTAIATIKHNDSDRSDRVTLFACEGSDWVWFAAEGDEPQASDVTLDRVADAWDVATWDREEIQPAWDEVIYAA